MMNAKLLNATLWHSDLSIHTTHPASSGKQQQHQQQARQGPGPEKEPIPPGTPLEQEPILPGSSPGTPPG